MFEKSSFRPLLPVFGVFEAVDTISLTESRLNLSSSRFVAVAERYLPVSSRA